ncbi:helix-turn-helix domain-containing protein [Pigmentiphaga soli]|uniref:Helix-turn-helix domain-containing protein n=1 Tax=Pigmentiphaga soli TaxID=1007095 RepID=A0ABP8HC74_9BURK
MQQVFHAEQHPLARRRDAWQEALWNTFTNMDAVLSGEDGYRGTLRKGDFGPVSIIDISLSRRTIRRRRQHLSHLDKDCFYLQFIRQGHAHLIQDHRGLACSPVLATLFYSGEPYELRCQDAMHALYLEVPREKLANRLARENVPVAGNLGLGSGVGKIAAQLCMSLAAESGAIAEADKARLGEDLLNIVALAIDRDAGPQADGEPHRPARLCLIQAWIEQHLSDPDLSLETIARHHGISVRLLHHLFRQKGESPSNWIWNRRLQKCYELITARQEMHRSITEIAYSVGFSSSSHFSHAFKGKFGIRPSEARQA